MNIHIKVGECEVRIDGFHPPGPGRGREIFANDDYTNAVVGAVKSSIEKLLQAEKERPKVMTTTPEPVELPTPPYFTTWVTDPVAGTGTVS